MSCYEKFGWGPDQVRALPDSEALLLAAYFDELARYHADQARKQNAPQGPPGYVDELVVDEDD